MFDVIFKTFVTFFVVYALIDIFTKLFKCIFASSGGKNELFVVIRVKNQENAIEGVVRSVIWKYLRSSEGGSVPLILIVDSGSTDATRSIALKLCKDYGFIYYMTDEKYKELKKQLGCFR